MTDVAMAGFDPPDPSDMAVAAAHVLAVAGLGGFEPGGFFEALIRAMFKADPLNLARFKDAFPAHWWAVWIYKNETNGVSILRAVEKVGVPDGH